MLSTVAQVGVTADQPVQPWTVVVLVAVVLAAALMTSLRVAAPDERVVVRRRGAVREVRGPGLVLTWPVLEQAVRVPLAPQLMDPLVVRARTRDGFELSLWASAWCRVVDPAAFVQFGDDPFLRAAEVVEVALARQVSRTDLEGVVAVPRDGSLARRVNALTAALGVEVAAVLPGEVELRMTPDLLVWADRRPAERSTRWGPVAGQTSWKCSTLGGPAK